MTRKSIKQVLMSRDGLTEDEAQEAVEDAKVELEDRLHDPDTHGDPFEICANLFGLEPDYIDDLY